MKHLISLTVLAAVIAGCSSSTDELARVDSPDRQACVVVTTREKHGIYLGGPEPPETLAKWARVSVEVKGNMVHDSGFEDMGRYQQFPDAFDVAWASDSSHVAYRLITTLRIINREGKVYPAGIPCTNSLISSFKWTSGKELLVVVKEIDLPLDMHGYPQQYHGYIAKAKGVKIVRLDLDGGVSERLIQSVNEPAFIFHSIGFENQEISPFSDRVAFSDGAAVCVYDDDRGEVVARAPLTGSLEGVWWETKDKLILGLGLLSAPDRRFASFDLTNGHIQDCTATLFPLWTGRYDSVDWFRAGKAQPDRVPSGGQPTHPEAN